MVPRAPAARRRRPGHRPPGDHRARARQSGPRATSCCDGRSPRGAPRAVACAGRRARAAPCPPSRARPPVTRRAAPGCARPARRAGLRGRAPPGCADLDAARWPRPHGAARLSDIAADLTLEPPQSSERPGRAAVDRRGLARHLDRALGQGPRVGRRPRPQRGRRQLPVRHGADDHRRPRGGAPAVLRRGHPAPTSAACVRAVAVPPPAGWPRRHHLFAQPSRFLSPAVTSCFEVDTAGHAETIIDEPVHAGAVVEVQLESLWN